MWFNSADIEKYLLFFPLFYVSGSFKADMFLHGVAFFFLYWSFLNQDSCVPIS